MPVILWSDDQYVSTVWYIWIIWNQIQKHMHMYISNLYIRNVFQICIFLDFLDYLINYLFIHIYIYIYTYIHIYIIIRYALLLKSLILSINNRAIYTRMIKKLKNWKKILFHCTHSVSLLCTGWNIVTHVYMKLRVPDNLTLFLYHSGIYM